VKLLQQVQNDFPFLNRELDGKKIIYLDSAATSLKPKQMVEVINDYYLMGSTNIHRGKNYLMEEASNRYEQARYKVANLIGCSGNEVVFVRNTTEAINLVANGLKLDKEDLVVVFSDAHHSNMLPWLNKASAKFVRINSCHSPDLEHYRQLLAEKPKVVALNHCSNVTGIYAPIEEMAELAKKAGAIVVLDAAQSIPHRPINLNGLAVDFMMFSGHKMLAPTGIGVLFGRAEQLEQLDVTMFGGGMVDWVDQRGYRLRKIPHRFEAGTPHIAGAYGLGAAIDYLNNIGYERLMCHETELAQLMLDHALKRDYLRIINPDPKADRGAVLSLYIPGMENLDDTARILSDSYGIMCRTGHLCAQPFINSVSNGQVLRISAYFYNSPRDIELFFNALDEVISMLTSNLIEI